MIIDKLLIVHQAFHKLGQPQFKLGDFVKSVQEHRDIGKLSIDRGIVCGVSWGGEGAGEDEWRYRIMWYDTPSCPWLKIGHCTTELGERLEIDLDWLYTLKLEASGLKES